MSDAHLSERELIDGPEPVHLSEEPIRLSNHHPAADAATGARPSRRGRVALGVALAVGLAGAGALGAVGWRIAEQKDTRLSTPQSVAGLARDDSEPARSTADYLRSGFSADIDLDYSFGTVYRDPAAGAADSPVLLFGGTTLLWRPERDLDTLFGLMADETGKVAGLREVPAGRFGGVMKCGTTRGAEGFTVCGWADHGSVVVGMFPNRTVDDAAGLFRQVREAIQTRG
ncbi:hypothetical protein E1193_24985 [Micromonospora sp. KC606]|uniref:hypothetical protein n=1 Tax=Micromonospora sp. KC606 TaxID=2530379 RepID=UPI001049DF9B|nr:hypothetical protein [Micromonospora sp. KC606]TDC75775.1 hypothetical protein E1193_24985 [Micromonospora sp. KC606]